MRTVLSLIIMCLTILVFIVTGVATCRMMQYEDAIQEMK